MTSLVDSDLINVTVQDEKVSLSGTVGSLAEKDRARRDAWVGGVNSVESVVSSTYDWWARDQMRRRTRNVSRTDEEIREAVRDTFLYDPRVLIVQPRSSK